MVGEVSLVIISTNGEQSILCFRLMRKYQMKSMLTGGQSGRLRPPQKGDAVGLTLGLRSFLRNPKSSTGFSFLQRGVLYASFVLMGSMTVITTAIW